MNQGIAPTSSVRAAALPGALRRGRSFEPTIVRSIGCQLPDLLEIYPTKPGFPGTLRDVVKTYSLPVTIQGRCGRAVLILCHNIRKMNAIFLAKYDVNKEILTFLLVEFQQNLSI